MAMTDSKPLTAYQPVKGLFVAASVIYCLLLRLPTLGFYFLRVANRQEPTWSWKQAVGLSTAKFFFDIGASARFARVFAVDRSPKDPNQSYIPAVKNEELDGVLLDPNAKPADLMGEWYPAPFKGAEDVHHDTKVILFMFGGAYVMGDNKSANYITTLKQLCPAINAKFLIISYRLAGSAGGQPFPSQLQDLFSAYKFLLHLGVAPKNILLAGESAGGNAIISFLRHLEDRSGHEIALPCAALLSSPWIDLTVDPRLRRKDPRYKTDFTTARLAEWGQKAFVPSDRKPSDMYISPALHPFRSSVPIWIESGTEEVAFNSLKRFAEDMEQAGTDIEFFAVPHGTHAHMWAAGIFGFDPSESVKSYDAFMKDRSL